MFYFVFSKFVTLFINVALMMKYHNITTSPEFVALLAHGFWFWGSGILYVIEG